jgi:predicted MFS family arabinose efflux permease
MLTDESSTAQSVTVAEPDSRSPLRIPAFRRIAVAWTVNDFGNWVGDVALAILVFDRTGSALATAALFLALRFLPALVGPLLTSRFEVINARKILPAIYLTLPLVLILGSIDGALAITAIALTRGATAAMLSEDGTLRRGNAILNIGFSAGGALGPALAGVAITALGVAAALLIDAATFAVVALILFGTRGLRLERNPSASWRERFRSGISEVGLRPGVRRLLLIEAIALIFFTAVVPIEVVFAKRTLGAGDSGYGALLAAWGAGMVFGSLGFAWLKRVPLMAMLLASTALIGAGYAGLALSMTLATACVFSAIGGIGNGAQWIAFVTAIQESIPLEAQSSVMSLVAAINQAMPAIGFLLGGIVATLGSPRTAYAVSALGVLVVLLVIAIRPLEGLDEVDRSGDEAT